MLVQVTGPVDAPRVDRLGVEVHSQRYEEIEEGSLDVPVVRAPGTQLLPADLLSVALEPELVRLSILGC